MEYIFQNFSWVRLLSNYLQFLMWFMAGNMILKRRFSWPVTIVVELLAFFPWFIPPALRPELSFFRVGLGNLFLFLTVFIIYKDKLGKKILTIILILITMAMSELMFMMALPKDTFNNGISAAPIPYQIAVFSLYLACNAMLLSFVVIAFRRFNGHYNGLLSPKELITFALFPITQYILLTIIFSKANMYTATGDLILLFFTVILCAAADVTLYSTMLKTAQSAELRVRNEILEEQISSQATYYTDLASQYENIRHLRHDIDNHMYTIKLLLKDGKTQDAEKYTQELIAEQEKHSKIGYCKNSVIDAFLHQRAERFAADHIPFTCNINMPAVIGVRNTTLICALGNMLDNAAEACQSANAGSVNLQINYRKPYLQIETENPVPPIAKKTSRIPGLERGLGFAILTSMADTYDGQFTHEVQNDTFRTSLILKEANGHAPDRNL